MIRQEGWVQKAVKDCGDKTDTGWLKSAKTDGGRVAGREREKGVDPVPSEAL